MIGEIRDLETAQIAVQASLTGHLVLATLHTNDAAGAVVRLVDMGIEPFLVARACSAFSPSGWYGACAPRAAAPHEPDVAERALLAAGNGSGSYPLFTAPGCEACTFTGYQAAAASSSCSSSTTSRDA